MTVALHPPGALVRIARTLEQAGHDAWVVGGVLRDGLTGAGGGDWDLATSARPQKVRRLFRRTVPLGMEHGTVGVIGSDGVLYQVTTFRLDVETDGRHATVSFADDIRDDLARRDFTINALAWHPLRDEWLDPFLGAADLEAGILRTVGDAADRFREDYLRVLRAFRFAGRLCLNIEASAWSAIREAAGALTRLSAERVREELIKVLHADPKPSRALRLYADSGALAVLYPEMEPMSRQARWDAVLLTVDTLPIRRSSLRLAALFREIGPDGAKSVAHRFRFSRADSRELVARVAAKPIPGANASDAELRRWLSATGTERLNAVARLDLARTSAEGASTSGIVKAWRRLRMLRRRGDPMSLSDLAIGGSDLTRLGIPRGPAIGRILDELLEAVLDDPGENTVATLEARAAGLAGLTRRPGGQSANPDPRNRDDTNYD